MGEDGHEAVNDMFHENRLLQSENQTLRTRLKALQDTINSTTIRCSELQAQKASAAWSKAGQLFCGFSDSRMSVNLALPNRVSHVVFLTNFNFRCRFRFGCNGDGARLSYGNRGAPCPPV